jgi:hypothetical protein
MLLCSDFHPSAYLQGWRRSFEKEGIEIEIESVGHQVEDILTIFGKHFLLEERFDLSLGEPERPVFESAGKSEALKDLKDLPAVIAFQWRRVI